MSSLFVTPPERTSAPPTTHARRPCLEAVWRTDPGLVRPINEDACLVDDDLGLYAVADGIGGGAAGEVASRLALDTVRAVLGDPTLPRAAGLRLVAAVEHANACVRAAAHADRAQAGMGTTLTAMLVRGNAAAIAHVGDTRAYRLRNRRLDQLTDDHTLIATLIQGGIMTPEDAATCEVRHIITRGIGVEETVEVDTRLVAVEPGETLLLCSDGLHGVVDDEAMAAILLREHDLTAAAARLVGRANELGGPDNISVVLVRLGEAAR